MHLRRKYALRLPRRTWFPVPLRKRRCPQRLDSQTYRLNLIAMYGPLPIPILILCIVLFGIYLHKHKNPPKQNNQPRPIRKVRNNYSRLRYIQKSMDGYSCERIEISVVNPITARYSLQFPLGTEVSFAIEDGAPCVRIAGRTVGYVRLGLHSYVRKALQNSMPYTAYITDRVDSATGFLDFFTVSVYYTE